MRPRDQVLDGGKLHNMYLDLSFNVVSGDWYREGGTHSYSYVQSSLQHGPLSTHKARRSLGFSVVSCIESDSF